MVDCKKHRAKHHKPHQHHHNSPRHHPGHPKQSSALRKKRADFITTNQSSEINKTPIQATRSIDSSIQARDIQTDIKSTEDNESLQDLTRLFGVTPTQTRTRDQISDEMDTVNIKKNLKDHPKLILENSNNQETSMEFKRVKRSNSNDKIHKTNKKYVNVDNHNLKKIEKNKYTDKIAFDYDENEEEMDTRPKRFADDDSLIKNRLEDIYPEAVQDVDYEIPLANLVRTKRFDTIMENLNDQENHKKRDLKKIEPIDGSGDKTRRNAPSLLDIKDLAQNIISKVLLINVKIN